jgi:hypothetical protein
VTAGCPCPVQKHAHDGTHKCRSHRDQGDLPARHVAGDAVEGVGRGPEPDDLGGRAGRRMTGCTTGRARPRRPPPGGGGQPGACRQDGGVRMGFMTTFLAWFAVGQVGWRSRSLAGLGGERQRPGRCRCWVSGCRGSAGAVASIGCWTRRSPGGVVISATRSETGTTGRAAVRSRSGPSFQVPPVGVSRAGG